MLSLSFLPGSCEPDWSRKPKVCGDSECADNWVKFVPPIFCPQFSVMSQHSRFSLNGTCNYWSSFSKGLDIGFIKQEFIEFKERNDEDKLRNV